MSTAVFWALVASLLALRLTPLWGVIVGILAAIIGLAVNVSMVAASASVLLGTVGNTQQAPGMVKVAEGLAIAVFAACAAMLAGVIHALSTGSFWPRSLSRR